MPTLTINGRSVSVPSESFLLQAIAQAGFEVPTLCSSGERKPLSSCYLCAVQIEGRSALQPACSVRAQDGMVVTTDSPTVLQHRRSILQMLFSEHAGDCEAPCTLASPVRLDIPRLLRHMQAGNPNAAAHILMAALPFPEIAARSFMRSSEKACRRNSCDSAVDISAVVAHLAQGGAADAALAPTPIDAPAAAVLGAGPAGLAATAFLRMRGYRVSLYGTFQNEDWSALTARESLPDNLLQNDISRITTLAASEFLPHSPVADFAQLQHFAANYAAVLLTAEGARQMNIELESQPQPPPPLFLTPHVLTDDLTLPALCARLLETISTAEPQILPSNHSREPSPPTFNCSLGRLRDAREKQQLLAGVSGADQPASANTANAPSNTKTAVEEARRCLHCDCRKADTCRLRLAADRVAMPRPKNAATRPALEIVRTDAGILFQPGKCIQCGRCIEITETEGEPVGLTWIGRGFEVRVSPPPGHSWSEALQHTAEKCAKACPTAAMTIQKSS
ncbi:MAG: 2Fe-2S iron-sulfur cluster-binding protein [Verrucomicrobiota bacterium]